MTATAYHVLQDDKQGDSNERHRKFTYFAMGLALLAMLACITLGLHRKDVLSLRSKGTLLYTEAPPPPYLVGWARASWLTCTTIIGKSTPVPGYSRHCPLEKLNTPYDGCISSVASNRVLLTADGLSSPHFRETFQHVLQSTVEARTPSHNPDDKSMVVVLDAAYDAFKAGTQLTSSLSYCDMRKAELESFGASVVTCVVLDPAARQDLWKTGQEEGGHSKRFGEEMLSLNDEILFDKLRRATVVFVECGSPVILLQNFRRRLSLKRPQPYESFGDLVRSRVNDDSDALAYVGVSSGSSIAGQTVLELSPKFGTSLSLLQKELGGDASGLGLVKNCSFYPHALEADESWLNQAAMTSHTGVMAIPNCQPVAYTDSKLGRMSPICP